LKNNEAAAYNKPPAASDDFDERADAFMEKKRARNKQAVELAQQFMDALRNKMLPENKTSIARDAEQEICSKLVHLALEINEDESEREGMGGVAIINLLLKTMLLQRDFINSLDYKLAKLEKQLSSIQQTNVSKND